MARYTGPRDKIARRFGVAIFGPSKGLELRNFPPGQHGVRNTRRKLSEYGTAMAEKQKLRYQYGVLEKQFRKFFAEAIARNVGEFRAFKNVQWGAFLWKPVVKYKAKRINASLKPFLSQGAFFPTVKSRE